MQLTFSVSFPVSQGCSAPFPLYIFGTTFIAKKSIRLIKKLLSVLSYPPVLILIHLAYDVFQKVAVFIIKGLKVFSAAFPSASAPKKKYALSPKSPYRMPHRLY